MALEYKKNIFSHNFLATVVKMFGTKISPYTVMRAFEYSVKSR